MLDLQSANLLDLKGLNLKDIMMDKKKIYRERERVMIKSDAVYTKDVNNLVCIGVDGKVDNDTLMYKEIKDESGNIMLKKGTGQEHHLTFTMEPGNVSGTYLTHKNVYLKGDTGKLLAKEALDVLEEFDSVTFIKAILLDNTAVNTGADNGLVTWLETLLDRKLLTIGCALHQNELPFRAVFKHIDGVSKSPNAFTGPIGKLVSAGL